MDTLKYKNYEGTAEIDIDRGICRGKILFINDLIIYEAETPLELKRAFENAVEDYLETCVELGREPKKPLKGQFNVRISPELHKAAIIKALKDGMKLNELVSKAIFAYVNASVEVNYNYNHFTVASPDNDVSSWVSAADSKAQYFGGTLYAAN